MSIIVFGGEKGGTGKTTLATNIAAMLARQGKDVLLLDTDRQGTASFWATVREEEAVEPRVACVQKFGKGLPAQVRDLAERYDEIVIDAGGRDSMELRYALGWPTGSTSRCSPSSSTSGPSGRWTPWWRWPGAEREPCRLHRPQSGGH